mmetsp:Transcript_37252/g.76347  ORF Transcript_37252/g.76347 Transcript_37252/m.76347 type:complete len:337 (-) Transcript_37252:723-1733(-)|eukprot:CAMPEP_0181313700 /NCGR_PEP_ID=MMETSP1101-20121128/14392_1 /TAXON_ID=46948 /ORGANISM="Rhodomonas abbreviata, Strain Caron Lab Isolate" /LENGTH=336 /DNA_ID=CAMNT_0023420679 /DNA_START=155 /DNA_END=1165 /DNA_ORIENTATION=+
MAPFKLPLIKLNRGPISIYDVFWMVPTISHLIFGLNKKNWIKFAISHGATLTPFQLGIAWGWLSQCIHNATWSGDGFSVPSNLLKYENGPKRLFKMCFQLLAPWLFFWTMLHFMGQQWIDEAIKPRLNTLKVCGFPAAQESTCEMKYCGMLEAIRGECNTGRWDGCCVQPSAFFLDEVRHLFILNYTMRMLTPILGLWVPLVTATVQATVRSLPSSQLGLMSNPNPHYFRAIVTGDWSYLHLVYLSVIFTQSLALISSKITFRAAKELKAFIVRFSQRSDKRRAQRSAQKKAVTAEGEREDEQEDVKVVSAKHQENHGAELRKRRWTFGLLRDQSG